MSHICRCSFKSFQLLKKTGFFGRATIEIKPPSFLVPSHLVYFSFFILHNSSVFDCKFIWKSSVNFSFIEFIFVMVKATLLLTYFRSSSPEVFIGKSVLKIGSKFTGEYQCRSAISIKMLSNFTDIAFRHGCSPINLLHIFRTPFLKNTSGRLLLILS